MYREMHPVLADIYKNRLTFRNTWDALRAGKRCPKTGTRSNRSWTVDITLKTPVTPESKRKYDGVLGYFFLQNPETRAMPLTSKVVLGVIFRVIFRGHFHYKMLRSVAARPVFYGLLVISQNFSKSPKT